MITLFFQLVAVLAITWTIAEIWYRKEVKKITLKNKAS